MTWRRVEDKESDSKFRVITRGECGISGKLT